MKLSNTDIDAIEKFNPTKHQYLSVEGKGENLHLEIKERNWFGRLLMKLGFSSSWMDTVATYINTLESNEIKERISQPALQRIFNKLDHFSKNHSSSEARAAATKIKSLLDPAVSATRPPPPPPRGHQAPASRQASGAHPMSLAGQLGQVQLRKAEVTKKKPTEAAAKTAQDKARNVAKEATTVKLRSRTPRAVETVDTVKLTGATTIERFQQLKAKPILSEVLTKKDKEAALKLLEKVLPKDESLDPKNAERWKRQMFDQQWKDLIALATS